MTGTAVWVPFKRFRAEFEVKKDTYHARSLCCKAKTGFQIKYRKGLKQLTGKGLRAAIGQNEEGNAKIEIAKLQWKIIFLIATPLFWNFRKNTSAIWVTLGGNYFDIFLFSIG